MKPVVLTLARDDLKEIHNRLIEFGISPPKKFRESFTKFCTNVALMPLMYPQYDIIPSYRKAIIEYDYIVFYKVVNIKSKTRVEVYRVLHGKRDIVPLLERG
ncbi:MAG: type II toxin-antitoxin system RelE/ParE family toxin [Oscillospiraceae bacterium]|jgi:plasmid stabilization system protein ParE|nr:type II toxin-antitoxin system RelE/ParE family toxin [Oscillospiraceae bacterium]